MNKLKLAMFRELEAERDELLNALLDVMNQACQVAFVDGKCLVHHDGLSDYEDAIALLERLGHAKRVPGQLKRWELVWTERLTNKKAERNQALRAAKEALQGEPGPRYRGK